MSHYDILGIAPDASADEIKKAYRQQIRQAHPDRFAAERTRLERAGDTVALARLDAEIETAKQRSQQLNEAYAILMDADSRKHYHQELVEQAQIQAYKTHPERGRRTVKTRRTRAQPKPDHTPWILLAVFVFIVGFSASQFTAWVTATESTPVNGLTVDDMQATSRALQVTTVSASPTPRSVADNLRLASIMLEHEHYRDAIDAYSLALDEISDDAEIYYQRGTAYSLWVKSGETAYVDEALADFASVLLLDTDFVTVYRERGLLYYYLWQQGDVESSLALADLALYLNMTDSADETVTDAIATMQTSEP